MRWLAVAAVGLALAACPAALASEDHPTGYEIQTELWCDDCQTTLAEANAVAYTSRAIQFINQRIAAGASKSEIKQEAVKKFYGHLSLLPQKPQPEGVAGRPRGRDHVPGLLDHARPVGLPDRTPDEGGHRDPDRRR